MLWQEVIKAIMNDVFGKVGIVTEMWWYVLKEFCFDWISW